MPSVQLMEAAGTALAEAVAGLAPQGPVRVVCGKGNNGGDGLVAARRLRRTGFEVEALELFAASAPGRPRRLAGRLRRGRRRDLRHRLRRGAARSGAAAIEAINRCGAPVVACDIASGVDASSGEIEGAAVEADLTVSFHARQARAPGRARQVAHRRAAGRRRSGSPTARRREPAGGDDRPRRCSPWRRAAGPRSTKFSSGQVTIAGGSRGLTGAVRMSSLAAIRAGAGYATVAVPADLEPVFEARPAGGDVGRLPRRRRLPGARPRPKAVLRAFERAAAGVLGPGLGRDPGSLELAREVVAAIAARWSSTPTASTPSPATRAARRAGRRPSSPRTPASSAACSAATPSRSPPTASPAPARPRLGRRGRRPQGRRRGWRRSLRREVPGRRERSGDAGRVHAAHAPEVRAGGQPGRAEDRVGDVLLALQRCAEGARVVDLDGARDRARRVVPVERDRPGPDEALDGETSVGATGTPGCLDRRRAGRVDVELRHAGVAPEHPRSPFQTVSKAPTVAGKCLGERSARRCRCRRSDRGRCPRRPPSSSRRGRSRRAAPSLSSSARR